MKSKSDEFAARVWRGKAFETAECATWSNVAHVHFEARTTWKGRRGRIDIKIAEDDGAISIVELKATDYDRFAPHSIRATAHCHARQIWRYINDYVVAQEKDVCPGIVYEHAPSSSETRALVEQLRNNRCIQVVWRD